MKRHPSNNEPGWHPGDTREWGRSLVSSSCYLPAGTGKPCHRPHRPRQFALDGAGGPTPDRWEVYPLRGCTRPPVWGDRVSFQKESIH